MKIRSNENHPLANLGFGRGAPKEMALVLRGGEFIATEALSASTLAGLSDLARCRPLVINGLELRRQDLAELAEEARAKGHPVWPRLSCPTNLQQFVLAFK
jgi:hypothetical protein